MSNPPVAAGWRRGSRPAASTSLERTRLTPLPATEPARQAAGRAEIPNEHRVEVRRATAHLVLELGLAQRDRAHNGYSYIDSENLFGLREFGQE